MGGKVIIKVTQNRRLSVPTPICNLLGVREGSRLEAYLDTSGKEPKLVLERQCSDEEKADE